ncbi:MAG: hypothetical protein H6742_09160 [Alphaproteobacteria bacterium]|nr:hypothetical protein [Alphaproteobacteria bacterium]
MLPVLLLLLGCDGGPSDVTVIRDVQIVHAGVDVPVAVPGLSQRYTLTVADPTGGGVELLAWACTGFDGECAEAAFVAPAERMVVVDAVDQGDFSEDADLDLTVPAELALLAGADTGLPFDPFAGVWFLACEPGLCPWIRQARDALAAGAIDAELEAFLGDPTAALDQVPADGSSLAQRRLPLATDDGAEPNANPELRVAGDPVLAVQTGAEVPLTFEWIDEEPGSIELQAFTTVGAMGPPTAVFDDPEITWFAGEEAGAGRLYVVARDASGGSALWRADASVE